MTLLLFCRPDTRAWGLPSSSGYCKPPGAGWPEDVGPGAFVAILAVAAKATFYAPW